jgi:hypothetical protein
VVVIFPVEDFWVVTQWSVWTDSEVSEVHAASIFRVKMEAAWTYGILPQHYAASQGSKARLGTFCSDIL